MKITYVSSKKSKPDFSHLGFGKHFTDYMLVADYKSGEWSEPEILPYSNFSLNPTTAVLHYGQGIFEGLKAYKDKSGKIALFRPRDNFFRMNRSAERLCMPPLDVEKIMAGLMELLKLESDWIPTDPGTSLYIRPTMIATDEALGVHPSANFKFFIILSPVGSYYANGLKPTRIMIEEHYVRAVIGGTGETKCMGNYAASLYASRIANQKGYEQVLWLDGKEHKFVEEVGAMNMFFVIDGVVKTPELNGSILPGITRDSVIKLLKSEGMPVEETKISIDEVVKAHKEGRLTEAFGSGTAAVISPVGVLGYKGNELVINNNEMGKISAFIYNRLTGIQYGKISDPFGWHLEVK